MAKRAPQWVGSAWKPDKRQAERGSNGPVAPKLYDSKKAATRAAKQDARISSDCRPLQRDPEDYKGQEKGVKVHGHDYNVGGGTTYSVVDHHKGHDFGDGKPTGPHVHVRPSHDSHGHIPTAYEHYYYKK